MSVQKLKKNLFKNKESIKFLKQIAGPLAPELIKLYQIDDAYSPEEISEKLNEKITNVRSTLNSLHFRGIACYKKERNKNTNLYEFQWNIKFKKIIEILIQQEIDLVKKIEKEIKEKNERDYFECPNECIEVPFEIAAAYNFKCPNCNNNLKAVDNKNKVTSLKRKRTITEKNVDKLNEILTKIEDHDKGFVCD